ncbi:MAG TPA: N-acetylmuramoyl-L-alanine amidase [Hyphomicrobium sp.]|nr:N-acetylmuramoyl-L-alanine amidase [Hyphomicrobium sp.]
MGTQTGTLVLKGACLLLAMLMHAWLYGTAWGAPEATATAAHLSGDKTRTTFRLDLTAGVTAEIFTLANPYRVIVDLPDVSFRLPDGTGQTGHGLVDAFRYGLFAERKARVVIDTAGPVRIERAAMAAAPRNDGIVFTFDMVTTAPESFGAGTGAGKAAEAERKAPAGTPPPPAAKPPERGKAVIMIDPGHGGIDGGAVSASNVLEKDVVLAVARELGKQLGTTGRYDVRMTRASDVFISLDQRVALSLEQGVDLFISLHADSLAEDRGARSIRGATIYTLSERASDEHARRMAEKENASDLVAGLKAPDAEDDDQVTGILIDLMKRETANFSADFSNTLVSKMKRKVALSRVPQRAAAFKVLKQTHAPSVLIELGYLSHPEDEKLLNSPDWHQQVAGSIAAAVDAYFAKRTATTGTP